MWAGNVGIQDEESWLEAIKGSEQIKQAGAWFTLIHEDGEEEKFQSAKWMEKLKDEKFKKRILQLMDEEIILRFEKKQGKADSFYDVDSEEES